MNQCDGCRAGRPLVNNMHVMNDNTGVWRDLMACQQEKCEPNEQDDCAICCIGKDGYDPDGTSQLNCCCDCHT